MDTIIRDFMSQTDYLHQGRRYVKILVDMDDINCRNNLGIKNLYSYHDIAICDNWYDEVYSKIFESDVSEERKNKAIDKLNHIYQEMINLINKEE